jgi:hypothetical protein
MGYAYEAPIHHIDSPEGGDHDGGGHDLTLILGKITFSVAVPTRSEGAL